MSPGLALAEDLRRVGVALLVVGIVAGFVEDRVATAAAALGAASGVALLLVGYWFHHREHTRSQECSS